MDCLQQLKQQAGKSMLAQARRDAAYRRRLSIPGLGATGVAQIMAVVGSPHRFRTKRQLWPYAGLAVVTKSRYEYQLVNGRVERKKKPVRTRGLNRNYNRTLKYVFKGAALRAIQDEPFQSYYQRLLGQGRRQEMARLTVACKIAAITLAVWKQGAEFDPQKVTPTA